MRDLVPAIALLLVASAPGRPAKAQDSPVTAAEVPAEAPPPSPPSGRDRLDDAVRNYQLGRRDEARNQLAALAYDLAPPDPQLRQEARVYLGELLYTQGDRDGARQQFETVLREDPAFAISHFKHPPDVCGYFEYVRGYVVSTRPVEPPPAVPTLVPRLHWTAWVPVGGIYQFSHGQPGAGASFLAGELVCLVGSASLWSVLASSRHYPVAEDEELQRITRLRWTQWGFTTGYWGLWGWSRVAAGRHWRTKVVPRLGQPGDGAAAGALDGYGVAVEGTF